MASSRSISGKRKQKSETILNKVPESLQAFIARRLLDAVAVIFTVFGAFLTLALLSYDRTDPSWNTASAAQDNIADIENWGGLYGAGLSDFFVQTIGIGGFIIALCSLVWGVRVYRRQRLSPFALRIGLAAFATIFSILAFSKLTIAGWGADDIQTPMGGVLGAQIFAVIDTAILKFLPILRPALAGIFGLLALFALGYALAMTKEELRTIARTSYVAVMNGVFLIYNMGTAFSNWVRHHNDPQNYQPRALKKLYFKLPKISFKRKGLLPSAPKQAKATPSVPSPVATPPPPPPAVTANNETEAKREMSRFEKTANAHNIPVVTPQQAAPNMANNAGQGRFNLSEGEWSLPDIALLSPPPANQEGEVLDEEALRRNAELLQNVLADFKVEGEIVSIHPGPVVTLYELEPAPGTKSARVIGLADDIARSMSAVSVRVAVVPGRNVIGIELPNKTRQFVFMSEMVTTNEYAKTKQHLPLILGKDIGGAPIMADLAKMPHLLVAGTTGSGKSVAVNTMILSLLYQLPPEKCRMIMIDPKMLELSVYDGIPHLLAPVVTEPGKAVVSLKWTVNEMEERYRAMSKLGVRNIEGYNARIREAIDKGETIMQRVQTGFNPEDGKPTYAEQEMELVELPYIVVIVDEFADLMLVAGKDVENAIQRLAQMARAAGIHLIMATQRPSVDVITGVIKANFPTRISFQVTSKVDSRTILGEGGAEQLLGMGDMLYMAPGGRITRVHGPFVSDEDVEKVVNELKAQGEPSYIDSITSGDGDFGGDSEVMNAMFGGDSEGGDKVDALYDEAVAIIAREGKASTSFIQRHLQIGYNRAARIIEEMERQGVVSPANATGKRTVLVQGFDDGQAGRV